jgi:hypothetical protein
VAVDVCQAEIAALGAVGEAFVIEAEPSMTEYDEEFYEEGFADGGEALEELVDER